MESSNSTVVEAQMLIRKPVTQVFEAFVDPEITTKFWFTKSSGKLELEKKARWGLQNRISRSATFTREVEPVKSGDGIPELFRIPSLRLICFREDQDCSNPI